MSGTRDLNAVLTRVPAQHSRAASELASASHRRWVRRALDSLSPQPS